MNRQRCARLLGLLGSALVPGCGAVGSMSDDDGGASEITLSQTNSLTITQSVACTSGPMQYITESSYYRAFKLSEHGVTGGFDITKVSFGIERTLSGNLTAKSQPAEVSVYSYDGAVGGQTIDLTKVTLLPGAHLPITVHDTAAPMMLDIPLAATVPAAAAAVVLELHIPNGASDTTKNVFFIGATEVGAQTQPAYQRAPGCMEPTPVTIAATGFPGRFLIMQVTGRTR
jgi:hypothetical protein